MMDTMTMLRQMMRVACAATLFFAASTAQAATISLTPSSAAVTAGDTFSIDIMASEVNLGGFDLWVGFQPGRVSAVGDPQFFEFLGAPESFQMSSTEISVCCG